MRKLWVIVLLIGVVGAGWWMIAGAKDRDDPLNQFDAFVYSENGILYSFELTSKKGKVKGTFHKREIIEDDRGEPVLEDNEFPLIGEATEEATYEFHVDEDGSMVTYHATFSNETLFVKREGEEESLPYKPVDEKELDEYVKTIQAELQVANEELENKEYERLNKFFSEFTSVYGYLYAEEDVPFQLFMEVDEANFEGDVTVSLLMMDDSGDRYEEREYELNGITDGHILELYTIVDGKEVKLEGNFHGDASSFDLSFWTTDKLLTFHAVTEQEFNHSRQTPR